MPAFSSALWERGRRDNSPIEFGFWFPGTVNDAYMGGPPDAKPRTVRRYHPIAPGVTHKYEVSFRFGSDESFRDMTRNTWRWAWNTLKPPVHLHRRGTDATRPDRSSRVAGCHHRWTHRHSFRYVHRHGQTSMELDHGGDGLRGQEHRVRRSAVARRRSRHDRTRAEDAPNRAGCDLVHDQCAPDGSAAGHRLRSWHRQAI